MENEIKKPPFCSQWPDPDHYPEEYAVQQKSEANYKKNQIKESMKEKMASATDATFLDIDKLSKSHRLLVEEDRNGAHHFAQYIIPAINIAISIATAGKCTIYGLENTKTSLNFFYLVVGPSGSGKTRTLNKFIIPLEEINKRNISIQNDACKDYEIKYQRAKMKIHKLKLKYNKSNNEVVSSQLIAEIEDIQKNIPKKPNPPASICLTSTAPAAIIEQMNKTDGNLALINHEGYDFFTQATKGEPSKFNDLYDNKAYYKNSISTGAVCIEKTNFNMIIAIQNSRIAKLYNAHSEKWLDSGYIARTLPLVSIYSCAPEVNEELGSPVEHYFEDYCERIYKIYERFLQIDQLDLTLSNAARPVFAQQIELHSVYIEQYPHLRSFIQRQSEHILKMAAAISLLDDPMATEISKCAIEAASYLFEYHLKMHDILLHHENIYNINGIEEDAKAVLSKIKEGCDVRSRTVTQAWLLPRVMKSRRSIDGLKPVIDYLIATNQIRETKVSNKIAYELNAYC